MQQRKFFSIEFLSTTGSRIGPSSDDTTLRLWDLLTGQEIHRFIGHEADIRATAVSQDLHNLAINPSGQTFLLGLGGRKRSRRYDHQRQPQSL